MSCDVDKLITNEALELEYMFYIFTQVALFFGVCVLKIRTVWIFLVSHGQYYQFLLPYIREIDLDLTCKTKS